MTTVKDIYDYINMLAPFDTQEEWDNSGFLIGDINKPVKTVVLSLDGTKACVDFAVGINADLLITHHPVIFDPLSEIKRDSAVYKLIKSDIAAISTHTPFDKAECGINTRLAEILCLNNTHRQSNGYVVVGELDEEMSIDDFAQFVSDKLSSSGLRYTDTDKLIKKVAVAGGACVEYVDDALSEADCFVTGDLKYHDMLDASEQGFAVISAGHFETESEPFLSLLKTLESKFADVEFVSAPVNNAVLDL